MYVNRFSLFVLEDISVSGYSEIQVCIYVCLQHCCVSASVAVFTLEDEQIVWIDKLSQTNKSSDVQTGGTNFYTSKSSDICPSRKTIFPRRFARRDEQVDDSTT